MRTSYKGFEYKGFTIILKKVKEFTYCYQLKITHIDMDNMYCELFKKGTPLRYWREAIKQGINILNRKEKE